jgi:hypothetical protein
MVLSETSDFNWRVIGIPKVVQAKGHKISDEGVARVLRAAGA